METLAKSNITSFVHCVVELVANSLAAHASAIAIRIHTEKREIQVIDNGIGIPKNLLKYIGEYDMKVIDSYQQIRNRTESINHTLTSIRRLSNVLTIASRYHYSVETFLKVFKIGSASNLSEIEQRPAYGTTISIYGFHEIPLSRKWNISEICFYIGAIAVTKLGVSFSIRDEAKRKIIMRIAKPHSPITVLKVLFKENLPLDQIWLIQHTLESDITYHGYVGLSDKHNITREIFLNYKPICFPLILELIKVGFKENLNLYKKLKRHDKNIFILLFLTFPEKEFTYTIENGKKHIIFYDIYKILHCIKNCTFKRVTEGNIACVCNSRLREAQLFEKISLKSKTLSFNNTINKHKKYRTSLMKKNKKVKKNCVVVVGFKRKKIISKIISNDCIKKKNSKSDNLQYKTNIDSAKQTTLCENLQTINSCSNIEQLHFSRKYIYGSNNKKSVLSRKMDLTYLQDNKITKDIYNNVSETKTNYHITNSTNGSIKPEGIQKHCNYSNNAILNAISPLSEWSDWIYTNNTHKSSIKNIYDKSSKADICFQPFFNKQFNFLPKKLRNIFGHYHTKLTNIKCFSPTSTISYKESWQNEQTKVRPCNLKQKLYEFDLSPKALQFITIINQINNEFIVAWMQYNGMKILLMIDQHAVHERIRYENLLLRYKQQNEEGLLSVNLHNPLTMEFSTEMCISLLRNKILLKKYGISLGSLKENTLLIRAIPQCLVKSNDYHNSERISPIIYNLLNEILQNHTTTNHANILPLTIHNAIASEACHGAIKFGDELTFEQCTCLIKLLKYTKFPNRCAHGRPTIVPIMEFSELGKRRERISEGKLNFASLKIRYKNKIGNYNH